MSSQGNGNGSGDRSGGGSRSGSDNGRGDSGGSNGGGSGDRSNGNSSGGNDAGGNGRTDNNSGSNSIGNIKATTSNGNSDQITPEQAAVVKAVLGLDVAGLATATTPQASLAVVLQAQQAAQASAAAASQQAQAQAIAASQATQQQAAAPATAAAQAPAASPSAAAPQRSESAVRVQAPAAESTTSLNLALARPNSARVDRPTPTSNANKFQESPFQKTDGVAAAAAPLATLPPNPIPIDTALGGATVAFPADPPELATSLADIEPPAPSLLVPDNIPLRPIPTGSQIDLAPITAVPTSASFRPIATTSRSTSTASGETGIPILLQKPQDGATLSRTEQGAIISVSTVLAVSILVAVLFFLRRRKQRKRVNRATLGEESLYTSHPHISISSTMTEKVSVWQRIRYRYQEKREARSWFGFRRCRDSLSSQYSEKDISDAGRRRLILLHHLDLGRQFSLRFKALRRPKGPFHEPNVGLALSTDDMDWSRPESGSANSMNAERDSLPDDYQYYDYADLPPLPPIKTGRDGKSLSNISEGLEEDLQLEPGILSYYARPESETRSFV